MAAIDNTYSAAYQNQYGGDADKAAKKYGIPADKFRTMINDISGFNPYKVNPDGSGGLAGLKQGNFAKTDIFNPAAALDLAAQSVYGLWSASGKKSWDSAMDDYKNIAGNGAEIKAPNQNSDIGAVDIMGNATGGSMQDQEDNAQATADAPSDKAFWQYGMSDIKKFFQESIFSLLFGIIGLILILGSIYTLFRAAPVVVTKFSK